ncbi:MAG: MFS transporter [Pseudomonadota bacterium]
MTVGSASGDETGAHDTPAPLSDRELYFLTAASAVCVANAYYIHPIIATVAEDFRISDALIGAVPAFNQIALALGILLLLPLGDRFSNRLLSASFTALQIAALLIMLLSESYLLFVTGSTLLGFFTIVPYLLPAYVSQRVPQERLGRAMAILTTGIIGGILLARVGSGALAELTSWRTVYLIAAGLMVVFAVLLPVFMEPPRQSKDEAPRQSYLSLIASIGPLIQKNTEIMSAGTIQGLNFGIFLSVWMGLGLHLTSDQMGYGTDVVGYLAALALANLVVTPAMGNWADRIGPFKARNRLALLQFAGAALFLVTGHSLWLLILPILLTNVPGPGIDVAGRMIFLSEAPETRTRLMTVYIVMMFAIGGLASWAGTAAYDFAGWTGNALLAVALSSIVVLLSWRSLRRQGAT